MATGHPNTGSWQASEPGHFCPGSPASLCSLALSPANTCSRGPCQVSELRAGTAGTVGEMRSHMNGGEGREWPRRSERASRRHRTWSADPDLVKAESSPLNLRCYRPVAHTLREWLEPPVQMVGLRIHRVRGTVG